jgi:hypothetical protein
MSIRNGRIVGSVLVMAAVPFSGGGWRTLEPYDSMLS